MISWGCEGDGLPAIDLCWAVYNKHYASMTTSTGWTAISAFYPSSLPFTFFFSL